jgi:DNA-binding FadR family transcriptional regulator
MQTSLRQNAMRDGLMKRICKMHPGERIPTQEELCVEFQASRTLVREVLCVLEYLNIIKVRPKSGSVVVPAAEWRTTNSDVKEWQGRCTFNRSKAP